MLLGFCDDVMCWVAYHMALCLSVGQNKHSKAFLFASITLVITQRSAGYLHGVCLAQNYCFAVHS